MGVVWTRGKLPSSIRMEGEFMRKNADLAGPGQLVKTREPRNRNDDGDVNWPHES